MHNRIDVQHHHRGIGTIMDRVDCVTLLPIVRDFCTVLALVALGRRQLFTTAIIIVDIKAD